MSQNQQQTKNYIHGTKEEDSSSSHKYLIIVNVKNQTLGLYQFASINLSDEGFENDNLADPQFTLKQEFKVSTAKNGINNMEGTGGTPLGRHVVAQKIGAGEPINSVFVGRVPTGEIYNDRLGQQNPDRDWILSRILWLKGCEPGLNLGSNDLGCCDTYQRYIYIHGTPDTEPMSEPYSHGCIRMRNEDIVWLFDQIDEGTPVRIVAD